jgi:hypothetical protein
MACYVVLIGLQVALRWHFKRQNALKAERLAAQGEKKVADLAHSFDDLTDIQNPNFVYIY